MAANIGGATASMSSAVGRGTGPASRGTFGSSRGVEAGPRASSPITFSSRSFADSKPGMFNHAPISSSKNSIISKSEVTKGINRFASMPRFSRAQIAPERHVARPSLDRPKLTGRERRSARVSTIPKAPEVRVSNAPVVQVAESRMNAPRPSRLEHSNKARFSKETLMKSRTIISLRTESQVPKTAPKKDVFSHVGRQEMRLQRMGRVEKPRFFTAPKVDVQKSIQTRPRKEQQMNPVVKKDFKSLVSSRIRTSLNTMAALSIDYDVAQAEKVVKIKQAVFPKISERQLQTQTLNSLVERYKNKTGVVISPEVQPDVKTNKEVQAQVDTLNVVKTQTFPLEQSEENKKKTETAVLKKPEDQHKEKKKFYFVEDVKAKAERVKAAMLAAAHVLKYRKEGEKVTGKDVASQMGQLGKEAISEVAHPRSYDGTLDQNVKELEAMGEVASVEDVRNHMEQAKAKAVKLSVTNTGEQVSEEAAKMVYGASLNEQDAYFKDNNRASGEFKLDEKGTTWFVPKTQAVAGQVA